MVTLAKESYIIVLYSNYIGLLALASTDDFKGVTLASHNRMR